MNVNMYILYDEEWVGKGSAKYEEGVGILGVIYKKEWYVLSS